MWVLVVEDENRLAAGLKKGLRAEGFAADVALTGPDRVGWPGGVTPGLPQNGA